MSSLSQRKLRKKKRIRSLKDSRLRKIRYNFRSLFYLWYREVKENFMLEENRIYEAFSYEQRQEKLKKLREKDVELQSALAAAPLGCGWCNNKMRDLVFEPSRQSWFCVTCYEEAHRLYPEEYP
jgi:hypothetical protein